MPPRSNKSYSARLAPSPATQPASTRAARGISRLDRMGRPRGIGAPPFCSVVPSLGKRPRINADAAPPGRLGVCTACGKALSTSPHEVGKRCQAARGRGISLHTRRTLGICSEETSALASCDTFRSLGRLSGGQAPSPRPPGHYHCRRWIARNARLHPAGDSEDRATSCGGPHHHPLPSGQRGDAGAGLPRRAPGPRGADAPVLPARTDRERLAGHGAGRGVPRLPPSGAWHSPGRNPPAHGRCQPRRGRSQHSRGRHYLGGLFAVQSV